MRYPTLVALLSLLFLGASAVLPSVTLSLVGVQSGSVAFPKGDVGRIGLSVSGSVDWSLCPLFVNITISGTQVYSIPYHGEGNVSFSTPVKAAWSDTYARLFTPTPGCFVTPDSSIVFNVRNTDQKKSYFVQTVMEAGSIVDASRNGYFKLETDETPSCNMVVTFKNLIDPSRTYVSNFLLQSSKYRVYLDSQLNSGNYTVLVSSSNCNLTYPTPTHFTSLWSLSVSRPLEVARGPIFLVVSPKPTSSCPSTLYLYDQSDKLMSQKTVSNYSDNNQLTFPEQVVGVYRLEWTCPAECFFSCSVKNHTIIMPNTIITIYRPGRYVNANGFSIQSNSFVGLDLTACPLSLSVYNTTVEQKKLKDLTVQVLNITTQMLDITNSPGSYLIKFSHPCNYTANDYAFDVLPYVPTLDGKTSIIYGEALTFSLLNIDSIDSLQNCPITLNFLFPNGSIAYSDLLSTSKYYQPQKALWLGTYSTQWKASCNGWWLYNLGSTTVNINPFVVNVSSHDNCTYGIPCTFNLVGSIPDWIRKDDVTLSAIDPQGNITFFSAIDGTTRSLQSLHIDWIRKDDVTLSAIDPQGNITFFSAIDGTTRSLQSLHIGTHHLIASTSMMGWDVSLINQITFDVNRFVPQLYLRSPAFVDIPAEIVPLYNNGGDLANTLVNFTLTDSKANVVKSWTVKLSQYNGVFIPYLDTFVLEAKAFTYGLDMSKCKITFTPSLVRANVIANTFLQNFDHFYGTSLPSGLTVSTYTNPNVQMYTSRCQKGFNLTFTGDRGFVTTMSGQNFDSVVGQVPTLAPDVYRISLHTECLYNTTGEFIISIYSHDLTITPNYVSYYIPTADLILSGADLNTTSTTKWSWSSSPHIQLPSNDSLQLVVPSGSISCYYGYYEFTVNSTTSDGIPTGSTTFRVTPTCFEPGTVNLITLNGSFLQTPFELHGDNFNSLDTVRYSLDFMYGPNNDTIFLGEQGNPWFITLLPPVSSTYGQFRVRGYTNKGDFPFIYSHLVTLESYTGDPRVDLKALLAQRSSFNLTAMVHLLEYSRNSLSATELSTWVEKIYSSISYLKGYETEAYVLSRLPQISPPTQSQRKTITDSLKVMVGSSRTDGGIISSLLKLVDQQMENNRTYGGKRDSSDLSLDDLYDMVISLADATFDGGNCQGATRSYLTNSISILSTTTLSDNLTLISDPYTMSLQSSVHNSTCKKAALIRWSRDPRSGMSQAVYTVYTPDAISGSVQLHIAGVDINDVNARYSCGYRPTGSSQSWNTADCHMTTDGITADISSSTDFTIYKVVITREFISCSRRGLTNISDSSTEMGITDRSTDKSTNTNALNGDGSHSKSPLSKGALAGIIIGSVLGFALLAGLVVFIVYRLRKRGYKKFEMN
ncbi:hypothetical protein PROFUN_00429 [Planoprotostelium fungivorum]|uniref:Ig-like domain-containing protein n=1 Tax=Planoprotostelium fungivorum TaxID=1890364 RepID=A0A2P6N0S7_9EUKA|nr:hypothetical protein PROFUN_00429 [Planoprotostelium fungivorum]